MDFSTDDVLLINAKPMSDSVLLLQMREINGKNTELSVLKPDKSGDFKLQLSSVTGEPIADPHTIVHFRAYETKFFRINLDN